MSLLVAAIGNGHTLLGLLSPATDEVCAHWRVATDERRTADEWAILVRGLLAGQEVSGVALCATVPSVLHEWREMLARYFADVPHVVVEPGVRTGLPVQMDNPREVGSDRIMNALAAVTRFGGPAIVVDFGVATTFDVVNSAGVYVGGAIAPGMEIGLEALSRRGAQLRAVELLRPRAVIAKNTVEAIQSGLLYGFASQVDGIVTRMRSELDAEEVAVIATGRIAPAVIQECRCFTHQDPWLTLRGLGLVFARNVD